MTIENLKGRCRCGGISVAVSGPPKWVANCHCASCRRSTGAAFSTYVGCSADAVAIHGECATHLSSVGVTRSFCGHCGTPISYQGERWPGEIHFFVGIFDEAESLVPHVHVYVEDALSWIWHTSELPRFPRTPGDS